MTMRKQAVPCVGKRGVLRGLIMPKAYLVDAVRGASKSSRLSLQRAAFDRCVRDFTMIGLRRHYGRDERREAFVLPQMLVLEELGE
jgi:hypothetical protein